MRLFVVLALTALVASGCLFEAAAGGAIPLTRSGDAGVALDLRGALAGNTDPGGLAIGSHLRTRFLDTYSEVAMGADGAAALVADNFAAQLRAGASIAPLIHRGDRFGFSPFGSFAELSLLGCSQRCYKRHTSSATSMFSLRLGVDHRLHFRSTDLTFGHDAFFTVMVGLTWYHSPRLM